MVKIGEPVRTSSGNRKLSQVWGPESVIQGRCRAWTGRDGDGEVPFGEQGWGPLTTRQDRDGSRCRGGPPGGRCGLDGGTTIHRETLIRKQKVQGSVHVTDLLRRLGFPGQGWWTRLDSVSGVANRRYSVESISLSLSICSVFHG